MTDILNIIFDLNVELAIYITVIVFAVQWTVTFKLVKSVDKDWEEEDNFSVIKIFSDVKNVKRPNRINRFDKIAKINTL